MKGLRPRRKPQPLRHFRQCSRSASRKRTHRVCVGRLEPEGGSEHMREHAFPPGEVAELKPGKSGHLSLRLKPASYVLYWNQAGHAQGGMRARFTVTK